jgi:DnaJ-class molecular chaperone
VSAPVYLPPPCPACDGSGVYGRRVEGRQPLRCPACGGTGAPPPLPEAMACVGCGRAFKVCACGDAADALDEAARAAEVRR